MRGVSAYSKGRADCLGTGDANKTFAVVCIVRSTTNRKPILLFGTTADIWLSFSTNVHKTVIYDRYQQKK